MKLKALSIFIFYSFTAKVFACSCIILPAGKIEAIKYKAENSEVIFIGTVKKVSKKSEYAEIATFEVIEPLKGISQSKIALENSACRSPSIKLGKILLVYSNYKTSELLETPPTCFEVQSNSKNFDSEVEVLKEFLKRKT